jgi:hypothetical protein
LLKKKSDAYNDFVNFQKLVERRLDTKILAIQSDWGREYEKLNSLFQSQGISHHSSCPHVLMPTNRMVLLKESIAIL